MADAAKSTGSSSSSIFYAYIALPTNNTSKWSDQVTLIFANVDAADEWWTAITGNATKWPSDFNMTKDNLKRHGPQWFSWPAVNNTKETLRKIEVDPAMDKVRGRWSFKVTSTSRDDGSTFPPLPLQDEKGWPVQSAEASNAPLLESLDKISATLKTLAPQGGGAGAGAGGAHGAADGGQGWIDGASGPGGYASYQVVEAAYAKAKELKDSGDDRSFGMIFAQLSMEMRRKV